MSSQFFYSGISGQNSKLPVDCSDSSVFPLSKIPLKSTNDVKNFLNT